MLLPALGLVLACIAGSAQSVPPQAPEEDGMLPALTAIAGHGMMNERPFQNLEELSDSIGGRVTGSAQASKAIDWALAKMRAIGLENVHAESWQLKRGWTRISADAELLAPIQRHLTVDSMGWVGSTDGTVEADVVAVNLNRLDDEIKDNASQWKGKILVGVEKGTPNNDRFIRWASFGRFLKTASAAHALGVIGGQSGSPSLGMHLTHTGTLGFDVYRDIPVVSMTAEDQSQIVRFLDQHKTVRLKLNVQNRVTDGPVESANVIGEIRGSRYPEQVVVVGGHLDSWDLAQGAIDDGVGVAAALGAAEAIIASGYKPTRTIRLVLFTGEEQGLLGSQAYTKTHKDEIANHVAAVILDDGEGQVVRMDLGGHDDLIPAVEKFTESAKAFGKLGVADESDFGADSGPFILAGLPGISLSQDSPESRYTHHSVVDTFDHVKPDLLIRNTTLIALISYWIASRPMRLATPWPPERTAAMLIEKKLDPFLKEAGLWTFDGSSGKNR